MSLFLVFHEISSKFLDDSNNLCKEVEKSKSWVQMTKTCYLVQREEHDAQTLYRELCQHVFHDPILLYVFKITDDCDGHTQDESLKGLLRHLRAVINVVNQNQQQDKAPHGAG